MHADDVYIRVIRSTSGYTPDDLSTAVDNVVDICRHDRLRNSVLGAGLKLAYAKKA